MSSNQIAFNGLKDKDFKLTHGGENSIGKRKVIRPFSSSKPIHLILRCSKNWGQRSLRSFSNSQMLRFYLIKFSRKFNVSLYQYSINSNHIHLLLRSKHKILFQSFLRSLAGTIALKLKTKSEKNKFWAYLTFSRVMTWGRDFKTVVNYIIQNQLEATGQISYKPRSINRYPKELKI